MPLLQSIVHRLDPTLDGERLTVTAAPGPADSNDDTMAALVSKLADTYNTKAKGWGRFASEGEQAGPLVAWLDAYSKGELEFEALSTQLTERLARELQETLSVGGYLVIAHQRQGDTETFFFALLHQREGIGIGEAHQAVPAAQLNTQQLTLAARVNLTQWQQGDGAGSQQYVSFLKDRGAKKLADGVAAVLGMEEGIDAPAETRTLLKAFSDYVESEDLDEEASREKTESLVDYAHEQMRRGEPMTLEELSGLVDEQAPRAFYEHIRNADYGLSPEIPPDKKTLSQFRRFTGRAGGVSISFDSHLLGSSIEYDEGQDRLIIKQVPRQLKEQLAKRKE
ncbi:MULTISPECIES: nucleoid-associated protein [unclassified Halomonas]|uniref:nucleoid-associated protein n=1 Tax=unclassified Halomonas TaxID=2609666 RepID=UPI0021E3BFF8|nr:MULTISPECIES: nucleoid-associated protein [unclassified Halomonas]UYG00415.1 nucleoid-associated protein [Halomonas sp. GD1P12]WNL38510.1 nucleoid-associated protein [Halomonas sp. PAMB 3232]